MPKFEHFIVTRFNLLLNQSQWNKDKNDNSTLTDEWMSTRLELFENYCLPSVTNQTNINFKWLIYFDEKTSKLFRNQIGNLFKKYSQIYFFYIKGTNFETEYRATISSLLSSENEYVISTRLDNDDVVHRRFIEKIQNAFNYQDYMAINFIKSYTLSILDFKSMSINYTFSNHFISLVERVPIDKHIAGCYSKKDRYWNKKGEVIQIRDNAYCMELIHETNLLNTVRGLPILVKKDLTAFQINRKYSPSKTRILDYLSMKIPWKKWLYYILKIY